MSGLTRLLISDSRPILTLQAVCVEELLTLLVTFDPTLGASHALACDTPQQSFALVAVRRSRRRPNVEVMRRSAGDRVDESLQRFLIHVVLLQAKR